MVWPKMYQFFQLHREEFDRRYHARSNVEAVFSAVQRKPGEGLLSKNPLARFNELPAKLLAYDIGILVHEIYENGSTLRPSVCLLRKVRRRAPPSQHSHQSDVILFPVL